MSWIQGYKIPFLREPYQREVVREKQFSSNEFSAMTKAIEELLEIGAVVPCNPEKGQFISTIFLADKSNGGKRFILNLKGLNSFVFCPHFKMEDYRTVLKLIQHNCFMSTVDLKDAYFLISTNKDYRKYLRFLFDGNLFEFTCLPFGLSSAPYCFTKLMKPILEHLRSHDVVCVNYLDDILILGDSYEECQKNTFTVLNILESLGMIVNYEKSSLTPSTSKRFLGFNFDSQTLRLQLPLEKKLYILNLISKFQQKIHCKIRDLAKLLGLLTSACPAVRYGWLYTKLLERQKFLALKEYNYNYEAIMDIPQEILGEDLRWWRRNILTTYSNIKQDKFSLEIFTDASLTGWGAWAGNVKTHGYWSDADKQHHINHLELLAIFYGLRCFAKEAANTNILLRCDNTTAIAYINRMGSIQFPSLNKLARQIWQWCEARNIELLASYINSKQNWVADMESRRISTETEWSLSSKAFDSIQASLGYPEIDLFASISNHKCKKYVSRLSDPGASAVDAFTLNWNKLNFYAFPPFCLILRVIHKIIQDKAEGIVVVPEWSSQPWYPLISKLKTAKPVVFSPDTSLLSSPFRKVHPLANSLTLVAWKLSAKHL